MRMVWVGCGHQQRMGGLGNRRGRVAWAPEEDGWLGHQEKLQTIHIYQETVNYNHKL